MGRRACSMAQLLLLGFLAVTAAVTAAEPSIRGAKASPGSRFISYDEVLAIKASQAAAAASEQVQQQADSAAAAPVPDNAGGKPAPVQEQQQKPVANKPASDLLSGLVAPGYAGKKPTAAAEQQPAAAEAPKLAEERQPAAAPSQPAAEEQKQQQPQQPAVQQPSAQDKPAADVDQSASQVPPALPMLSPADQAKPVASEKPAATNAPQTQQPAAQPKPEGQEGRPVQQQKPELPLAAEVPAKQLISDLPECNTGDCCQGGKFKPRTACRAAKHPCDEPEYCTGTSATCPEDDSKNKPDGTTCAWLPTSNPTVGRFMADASKLQLSAVSLQAAVALMPMVASTQAYGSSSSSDAGLQQCTGKCYQGLCSVNFDILHCCLAKQHYLQKRREEAHHHGRDDPEPDYPDIYNRQHDKTREEYFYGPDFEPYTDAAARYPESRKSPFHGPQVPVKATTSRTRLVVDDPYAADYVAHDIHQYQELYEELHDAEEQISQVLRRKYQDLDSLEREEKDMRHRGYVRHEEDGAPYTSKIVGEDSPHSYGKEGEEGAPYAPWWEADHPADGGRAYCWQ